MEMSFDSAFENTLQNDVAILHYSGPLYSMRVSEYRKALLSPRSAAVHGSDLAPLKRVYHFSICAVPIPTLMRLRDQLQAKWRTALR
jgi:hypothetical protein